MKKILLALGLVLSLLFFVGCPGDGDGDNGDPTPTPEGTAEPTPEPGGGSCRLEITDAAGSSLEGYFCWYYDEASMPSIGAISMDIYATTDSGITGGNVFAQPSDWSWYGNWQSLTADTWTTVTYDIAAGDEGTFANNTRKLGYQFWADPIDPINGEYVYIDNIILTWQDSSTTEYTFDTDVDAMFGYESATGGSAVITWTDTMDNTK